MAEHPPHHHHHHDQGSGPALRGAAALTVAFAVVEALGGWWSGSLALLSDAGHMVTDGAALALGALAAWMGRSPPSERHSYGLGRAEIFAALLNAAAMLAIVAALAYESVLRIRQPGEVNGAAAAVIALAALAINLGVLRGLAPHGHDMNGRAAGLHLPGAARGWAAARAAGAVR